MAKKSIVDLTDEYARNWVAAYLYGKTKDGIHLSFENTLQGFVEKYLNDALKGILDSYVGIKRSSRSPGDVELSGKNTIVSGVLDKAQSHFRKRFEEMIHLEDLVLSKKEIASIRKRYRERLLDHLDTKVDALATNHARVIAESSLKHILTDGDQAVITEETLRGTIKLHELAYGHDEEEESEDQ